MKYLSCLLLIVALCSAAEAQPTSTSSQDRPNVVLIVADDLGYSDVGYHKLSRDVRTPNIDALAANGVSFSNSYVSCPVCSPTRAALMTGRYQQRFGFEQNPRGNKEELVFGLPVDEITVAQQLKSAGYATAAIGKWHLGDGEQFHPNKRGFDEFFGFLGGAHGYLNLEKPRPGDRNAIQRNGKPVGESEYLTDALTREAVSFIETNKDKPFFVYLAYNAPHTPLHATEKYLSRFAEVKDEKRRTFLAMMSAMDDGIGRVMQTLDDAKLTEKTLVIFMSDNGGPTHSNTSPNAPLRGEKGGTFEGGVRVPMAMQWTGRLPAGKVEDRIVSQLDFFPTILKLASAKIPEDRTIDGRDLMPYLAENKEGAIHEKHFWRFGPRRGVRVGDLKLQWNGEESPALYDLSTDVSESKNLAEHEPKQVDALLKQYRAWSSEMMKPRWPGRLEGDGQGTMTQALQIDN